MAKEPKERCRRNHCCTRRVMPQVHMIFYVMLRIMEPAQEAPHFEMQTVLRALLSYLLFSTTVVILLERLKQIW